jgi:hypothetical protein
MKMMPLDSISPVNDTNVVAFQTRAVEQHWRCSVGFRVLTEAQKMCSFRLLSFWAGGKNEKYHGGCAKYIFSFRR